MSAKDCRDWSQLRALVRPVQKAHLDEEVGDREDDGEAERRQDL